ncbi:MAG TPA: hypothetical protein ENH51_06240 [Euryarchaeota archaeon]|nr:hypothetical protein [Euryarchaeota archaeon]
MSLTDFQKDEIREVMMIGSGHASTALASKLKREIDIRIPEVDLLPLEEVPGKIDVIDEITIGVYTEIKGDLRGRLLTVFSEEDALRLEEMVSGRSAKGRRDFSAATVTDVSDVLGANSLSAISDFFGMKIEKTPSESARDILGALLQQVLLDISQHSDVVLFSRTEIFVSAEKFNCHQMLFLEASSLEKLLKAMDVML